MQAVKLIPSNRAIISNDIEAIMFYTGRPAYRLPELQTGVASPLEEQFGSQPSDPVQGLFSQECAALVMFTAADWRFIDLYGDETGLRLQALVRGLYKDSTTTNGAIYYYDSACP